MVKRWKDELILVATLVVCALFGGYFGGKLAQMRATPANETFRPSQTFGQLPPEPAPTVIVIVLHDSPVNHPESASNRHERSLNDIQTEVNII